MTAFAAALPRPRHAVEKVDAVSDSDSEC